MTHLVGFFVKIDALIEQFLIGFFNIVATEGDVVDPGVFFGQHLVDFDDDLIRSG